VVVILCPYYLFVVVVIQGQNGHLNKFGDNHLTQSISCHQTAKLTSLQAKKIEGNKMGECLKALVFSWSTKTFMIAGVIS
jgi:hypothetical protein